MNSRIRENKTAAIIPFFNECGTVRQVAELALLYTDHVIAVDDGSTDHSASELKDLFGVSVLKNDSNMGKGFALRRGIEWSYNEGFSSAVTLDADLQHDPAFIPALLHELSSYDLVIGSRMSDISSMPFHRKLSNILTSAMLSYKTGVKIIDSQCGFRAFRLKEIMRCLPEFRGFEAESEMIVKAARNRLRIGFANIPTIYANEKSKMRALQAIAGFIRVYLK